MFKKVESRKSKAESQKLFFIITIACCLLPIASFAQCAMCRAALDSSDNTAQAEAVNDGIVFLMVIPYILVALVGFAIYKLKYSKK